MYFSQFPGVDYAKVRCHLVAFGVVQFLRQGGPYRMQLPIDDPDFIPRPYSDKQSDLFSWEIQAIARYAFQLWPQHRLKECSIYCVVSWLESLNRTDQSTTLHILQDFYGFSFFE